MGPLVPGLGSRTRYKMDYSLLPLGVVLMEFSVFATQYASDSYSSLADLMLMRLVHTMGMLILALSVGWVLIRKKHFEQENSVVITKHVQFLKRNFNRLIFDVY